MAENYSNKSRRHRGNVSGQLQVDRYSAASFQFRAAEVVSW
jgi:hypothetical protein